MFPPTEPSLTLTNLTQLLQDMRDLDCASHILNIPFPVYMQSKKFSESEFVKALGEWYLKNYPCPSWRHVARGLYKEGEHGVLEVLKSRYLKGESCGL